MDERSIASITKVMTAIVFLETATDLNQEVQIVRSDTLRASTTYLRTNDRVACLGPAAPAADSVGQRRGARAGAHLAAGLRRLHRPNEPEGRRPRPRTTPPTPIRQGCYADNISSAYDMARLIAFASEDDRIGPIMRTPEYSFRTIPRPQAARVVTVRSTNQILRSGDMDVLGGKTGFISKAGYCLATLLKMPQGGPSLAVVVLGATSNLGRFWETRHLMSWLAERTALGLATPAVATAK